MPEQVKRPNPWRKKKKMMMMMMKQNNKCTLCQKVSSVIEREEMP
jgi:hypothetical protein